MKAYYAQSVIEGAPMGDRNAAGPHKRRGRPNAYGLNAIAVYNGVADGGVDVGFARLSRTGMERPSAYYPNITSSSKTRLARALWNGRKAMVSEGADGGTFVGGRQLPERKVRQMFHYRGGRSYSVATATPRAIIKKGRNRGD